MNLSGANSLDQVSAGSVPYGNTVSGCGQREVSVRVAAAVGRKRAKRTAATGAQLLGEIGCVRSVGQRAAQLHMDRCPGNDRATAGERVIGLANRFVERYGVG